MQQTLLDLAGDRVWTVPNAMTMVRMALAPVVAHALLTGSPSTAAACFAVAGALDAADGWVARSFEGQASVLGSYLDPLADKVLVAFTAVALAATGDLPGWAVFVMVGRDVLLVGGGLVHRFRTRPEGAPFFSTSAADAVAPVEPSALSKANTFLQLGFLGLGLAHAAWGCPAEGSGAVTAAAVLASATTVASGWGYWKRRPYAALAPGPRKGVGG